MIDIAQQYYKIGGKLFLHRLEEARRGNLSGAQFSHSENHLYGLLYENKEMSFFEWLSLEKSQAISIHTDNHLLKKNMNTTKHVSTLYQMGFTLSKLKIMGHQDLLSAPQQDLKDYMENFNPDPRSFLVDDRKHDPIFESNMAYMLRHAQMDAHLHTIMEQVATDGSLNMI